MIAAKIPMKRSGTVEDIANAVAIFSIRSVCLYDRPDIACQWRNVYGIMLANCQWFPCWNLPGSIFNNLTLRIELWQQLLQNASKKS